MDWEEGECILWGREGNGYIIIKVLNNNLDFNSKILFDAEKWLWARGFLSGEEFLPLGIPTSASCLDDDSSYGRKMPGRDCPPSVLDFLWASGIEPAPE